MNAKHILDRPPLEEGTYVVTTPGLVVGSTYSECCGGGPWWAVWDGANIDYWRYAEGCGGPRGTVYHYHGTCTCLSVCSHEYGESLVIEGDADVDEEVTTLLDLPDPPEDVPLAELGADSAPINTGERP